MKRTKSSPHRREPAKARSFLRALRIEPLEDRRLFAVLDLASLGTAGVTIYGVDANDESGISVSHVGDVNGDGFEDMLIGARYADAAANARLNAGESYLVFGKGDWSGTPTLNLANLGTGGVTILGSTAFDYSGRSVSGAGDVNGDGFDDLLIGAPDGDGAAELRTNAGESHIIFGKSNWTSTPTIDLANLGAAGVTLYGVDLFDYSGRSVSAAGDINGDGFDDLLIGAHYGDAAANSRIGSGETVLLFGKAVWPATTDMANLGTAGVTIHGAEGTDASGLAVSGAGDINGDGFDDLLIGARYADGVNNARSAAGDSYLVFGKADWSSTLTLDLASLGTAGVVFRGVDSNDYSGLSLSGAGDVNGDGFDDLLIGALGGDGSSNNRPGSGETYLIFGRANWSGTTEVILANLGAAGVTFYGVDALDASGFEVSGAGDINGDGFDDLLIGARYADAARNARSGAGDTYVVFGRPDWSTTPSFFLINLNTDGITIDGAESNDNSGWSVSNAGDVNGDGFDDLMIGAPAADGVSNARLSSGETYLIFGSDNFTSSATRLGTSASETLTGTLAADVIIGGGGHDVLVGAGGTDVLRGGEGNDVLAISSLTFRRVVGGRGTDTLRVDAAGLTLDLTTRADNQIQGIEQINLSGTGANTLTLNFREVLNLSNESNTLVVLRDGNDTVNRGTGWNQVANEVINGNTFEVFKQGAATLKVQFVAADISLNLISSASTVLAGNALVYTVRVANAGPTSATGVTVSDTLPAGLTFDAGTSSALCSAAGQVVTCNAGTIAPGSNHNLDIGVKVASSVAHGSSINNTATVTANEIDPTPNDHSASVAVTVNRQADVRVTNVASRSPVIAGEFFNYAVQAVNAGPSDASGVTISDTLPPELTFDATRSHASCSASGQVVTCNVGSVAAGATTPLQIGVRVPPWVTHGITVNNTVDLSSNEADPSPGDHSGTAAVIVNRQTNLGITSQASHDVVIAGGAFTYSIRLSNAGPSDGSGVTMTDTLPAGLTFDGANSSSICSTSGQNVTCTIGTFPPGSNNTVTLAVNVSSALARRTLLTNVSNIAGNEFDPVAGNESSTVKVTVNVDPDPLPWQNVRDPLDANNDRFVTPIDVLVVINELNQRRYAASNGQLPIPAPQPPYPYVDVSGDNFVVPNDALTIINALNTASAEGAGEGESSESVPSAPLVRQLPGERFDPTRASSVQRDRRTPRSVAAEVIASVTPARVQQSPTYARALEAHQVITATQGDPELEEVLEAFASDVATAWWIRSIRS